MDERENAEAAWPDTINVDTEEAARLIGVSRHTLENWRSKGIGPEWVRQGARVLYPVDGLRAYNDAQRETARAEMAELRAKEDERREAQRKLSRGLTRHDPGYGDAVARAREAWATWEPEDGKRRTKAEFARVMNLPYGLVLDALRDA